MNTNAKTLLIVIFTATVTVAVMTSIRNAGLSSKPDYGTFERRNEPIASYQAPPQPIDCTYERERLSEIKRRMAEITDIVSDANMRSISETNINVLNRLVKKLQEVNRENENLISEQLRLMQRMGEMGCPQSDMFGY